MKKLVDPLRPFEFHTHVRDYFKAKKKTWNWFSTQQARQKHFQEFKSQLLKDSYRLDLQSHPEMFAALDDLKQKMDLPLEIQVYQERYAYQINVRIVFQDKEALILFSGPVLKHLTQAELKAVLAHELYHYYFFKIEDREYEIADRIITNIANDQRSQGHYLESARIFKLYTELYCDRGAYEVLQDKSPLISSLIKLETQVDSVNTDSYLAQATEILAENNNSTEAISHPENYIRAKALDLWEKKSDETDELIRKFIEPRIEFSKLNLFSQEKLAEITKKLVSLILKPTWNKTDRALNLSKEYFGQLALDAEVNAEELLEEISTLGDSAKKYLSYVLLDFALCDPDQGNVALAYTLEIAENAEMITIYDQALKKELKITVRKLKDLKQSASKELNEINESQQDSLYDGGE